jgi:hypothetical protein
MKIFIAILFFLIVNTSFAQTTGVIKVRKKSSNLLTLNGYTDGPIQSQYICDGKGLYIAGSERYKVTGFIVLLETTKQIEVRLSGNIITGEICENIVHLKTGDVVYINNINALDNTTGKTVKMPSLRFQIRGADTDPKKQRYNVMQED